MRLPLLRALRSVLTLQQLFIATDIPPDLNLTATLCSLPALLDHVQQRAAADMLLLGQADPAGAAAAVQEVAKDTASGNKSGFFNFFANIFEVVLKAGPC